MRRGSRFFPGAVLLLTACAGAAELEDASVRIELTYGYGLESQSSMQGVLELLPGFDFSLDEDWRLVTSTRLRLDSEDALEPGRPDLDSYAPWSRPATLGNAGTAEIRDLYLEWRGDGSLFRFGKQQIAWGRLDGLKVLDVVNPQEFREFILDDFGDSRIGLWSAYLDVTLGAWRTELALVPDATTHAIPGAGAWFELTAPRFRFGAGAGDPALPVDTDAATHRVEHAAAGLRLSRRVGRVDLAAVAYTGQDHEPLGRIVQRSSETLLQRYNERRDLLGFSAERGFGRAVLRFEYAFQPERQFNTRSSGSLGVVGLDQHRGAFGLDVSGPFGIFVNAQYLVDVVRDAPASLVRPDRDQVATLFLRRSFAYDRLTVEFRWYHSVRDSDDIFSVSVDYLVGDNTAISLGAEQFSGAEYGLFGQFDDQDRVSLGLRLTF